MCYLVYIRYLWYFQTSTPQEDKVSRWLVRYLKNQTRKILSCFMRFCTGRVSKCWWNQCQTLVCDQNRKHVLEFSRCPKIINRTPISLKISIFTCIIAICGILMTMIKILGFFVVRKYILLKRDFICIHNIGVRFLSFQMLCLVNTVVCVSFVYINWQWTNLDVEYVLYQLQQ
jgi:hypothetical protein